MPARLGSQLQSPTLGFLIGGMVIAALYTLIGVAQKHHFASTLADDVVLDRKCLLSTVILLALSFVLGAVDAPFGAINDEL